MALKLNIGNIVSDTAVLPKTTKAPNIYSDKEYTGYWYAHDPETNSYRYYDETKTALKNGKFDVSLAKYSKTPPAYDETTWSELNQSGIDAITASIAAKDNKYIPYKSVATTEVKPKEYMTEEEYRTYVGNDELDNETVYNNIPAYTEPKVIPQTYEQNLDKTYKRNMALLGFGIPMQLRAALQPVAEIGAIPYTNTVVPESISNVAASEAALNKQVGTAYSIGAQLGKYGPTGLSLAPGTNANILSEAISANQEIANTEGTRLNAQEVANAEAANKTAASKTEAELARMTLQGQTNDATQTQKSLAMSNLQEILTSMANQGTTKMDNLALQKYYKSLKAQAAISGMVPTIEG